MENIVFLRAVGAVAVLLSHLLCMFWVRGGVGDVWPFLFITPTPDNLHVINLADYLSSVYLDLGSIGVALFFIITGYLIPDSVRKYRTPGKFLLVKSIRIYPVYILGFSITFFNIWLYTHFNGIAFPYAFTDWLTQVSLLRVFFWLPSIDGISWTLVADMQLYFLLAFMIAIRKTSAKHFVIAGMGLAAISAFCSINMPRILEAGRMPLYYICSHITLAAFCLTFMLIGTVISEYENGKVDKSQFIAAFFVLYFCFLSSCASYSIDTVFRNICSYTLSLLVFLVCFVLEKNGHCTGMFENREIGGVSRISYSLFILHGLNGYILETVLYKLGVNNYLNFGITVITVCALSVLFYYCCEKPMSALQKRISGKMIA